MLILSYIISINYKIRKSGEFASGSSYTHKIGDQNRRAEEPLFPRIEIKEGVWIGAGAIILGGVTIGEGSIIGAGAVIRENVPPNTLVTGVPGKVIKKLNNMLKSPDIYEKKAKANN